MMPVLLNSTLYSETRLILVIAIVVLTSIFLFYTVSVVRYQRKYLRVQRELTKAEVDTLEKERQRIASDLHDSLGPLLSAVKLQINSLDTQLPDDLKLIQKAGGYIDNVMTNIRAVSNSLAPKLLARKGLVPAIEDLARTTSSDFSLPVQYEPVSIPRLAGDNELHIYRIIQEIIHNTVKHARCTQLIIQLYSEKQTLILLTADDGQGYDVTTQKESGRGLGLRNMETRSNILNGTMEVHSKPAAGTRYVFEFPLNDLLLNKAV
jgi:two-component system, NarL family, sensor kinase